MIACITLAIIAGCFYVVFTSIHGQNLNDSQITSDTKTTEDAISKSGFVDTESSTSMNAVNFDTCGGYPMIMKTEYEKAKAYGYLPYPKKTGYRFLGWFTEKEGGKQLEIWDIVSELKVHTFYAHWEPVAATVTLECPEGEIVEESEVNYGITNDDETEVAGKITDKINMSYDEKFKDLPVPVREGFAFAGWYTREEDGERILNGQRMRYTEDITLYAHWVTTAEAKQQDSLSIMMYHWFYNKDTYEPHMKTNENWMDIEKFETHMKYLRDQNYYFPTWEEVALYIDGKLTLPKNSVVITVDDGQKNFFELAIPVINKYNIHATSFLITSKTKKSTITKFTSYNVEFRSHTHNMHIRKSNSEGVFLTDPLKSTTADLEKSKKKLGQGFVLAYPFGHSNANTETALKNTGFVVAVTTQQGQVSPGMDKLYLPRVRMSANVSFEGFKSLL